MRWTITVIVALVLAAGLWWLEQERQTDLHRSAVPLPTSEPAPEPRYPLPQPESEPESSPSSLSQPPPSSGDEPAESIEETTASAEPSSPLPELGESDEAAIEALTGLTGQDFVQRWIKPEYVIPRTVAIVNSLDGPAPAIRLRPVETMESEPITTAGNDGQIRFWADDNARRYDAFIETLESVSPQRTAAVYARHYPLFQQAWEALGEAEAYFNDRLIDVIDHLLSAPERELPIAVQSFEGRLVFVDETLEQLSWGRKLLLRMGPEHAGRVRVWLRNFRREVLGNHEPREASE